MQRLILEMIQQSNLELFHCDAKTLTTESTTNYSVIFGDGFIIVLINPRFGLNFDTVQTWQRVRPVAVFVFYSYGTERGMTNQLGPILIT